MLKSSNLKQNNEFITIFKKKKNPTGQHWRRPGYQLIILKIPKGKNQAYIPLSFVKNIFMISKLL